MGFESPTQRPIPKESTPDSTHTTEWDDRVYDVYKLIHAAESLPAETIPVQSLERNLSNQCWFDENGKRVGPADIIRLVSQAGGSFNPEQLIKAHPELAKIVGQIVAADYSHPLLVVGDHIIDGMHRYTKAQLMQEQELRVKGFSALPESALFEEKE